MHARRSPSAPATVRSGHRPTRTVGSPRRGAAVLLVGVLALVAAAC